jgi:hypothetical protein
MYSRVMHHHTHCREFSVDSEGCFKYMSNQWTAASVTVLSDLKVYDFFCLWKKLKQKFYKNNSCILVPSWVKIQNLIFRYARLKELG